MFDILITTGLLVSVLALVLCVTEAVISGIVALLARLFPGTYR